MTNGFLYTVFDASMRDGAGNRVVQVDEVREGDSCGSSAPIGLFVPDSVPAGQYSWEQLSLAGAFYR